MNQRAIYILLIALFCIETLLAEGVKELSPTSEDRVFLYLNDPRYNNFGQYDGEDDQRLHLHIANPSQEQVFLGFSQPVSSGHAPCNNAVPITAFFRIKDPSGRVVYPIKDNPNGQILNPTTTNITSYNQAITGPKPISGQNGYTPFTFDPAGLPAGDYYIEFSTIIDQATSDSKVPIEWFDITVASKTANPTAINGRLFAKNWALFTPSISCGEDVNYTWFDRAFNGNFFVYTDQNIVVNTDFQGAGFQPGAFNVVFNDVGTTSTNDVIEDRKSRNNERSSIAKYSIFLNNPDINVYPSGTLGEFLFQPSFLVCENGSSCLELTTTEPGQIDLLIELDTTSGQLIYDPGTADVLVAFKVEPAPGEQAPYTRCIPWDGRNGFGELVEDVESIKNVALLSRYTQGIYHFPIYDAEYMLNGFDVTTIRPIPNNGSAKRVYYDDIYIPDSYGDALIIPKEEAFNGCDVPCHAWTNKDFGDLNTINTWFFAREEYKLRIEINECPFNAVQDVSSTLKENTTLIDVLANDVGNDKVDIANLKIGFPPPNGSAFFDKENLKVNYTPNPSFVGQDTFFYISCYKTLPISNLCDSTMVVVTVSDSPSVSITTLVNSPTNISPIPIIISFSEPVTGFELTDILVDNGVLNNFRGSGSSYTAEIIPNQDGLVNVMIGAGVAQGSENNHNKEATPLSLLYDATRPTPIISTTATNPTPFSPIPITITFDEPVSGFTVDDVEITNATIHSFTPNGNSYNLEIIPISEDEIIISINEGVAEDAATNTNISAIPLKLFYNPVVLIQLKVLLQSPYDFSAQLMSDDLRKINVIPLEEPYTNIVGFTHADNGGGETIFSPSIIFRDNGPNAIVDWIFIELRDKINKTVVSTMAALVQRDGDVVNSAGLLDLAIGGEAGEYYIVVRHRNHLSAMTATPISLNKTKAVMIDFTTMPENHLHGHYAQVDLAPNPTNHKWALWGGNTNNDNKIIFQGNENDSNPVFFEIMLDANNTNASVNYIVTDVYSIRDINMDGQIIFQGTNNELAIPLFNILQHPNSLLRVSFIILEQLP